MVSSFGAIIMFFLNCLRVNEVNIMGFTAERNILGCTIRHDVLLP